VGSSTIGPRNFIFAPEEEDNCTLTGADHVKARDGKAFLELISKFQDQEKVKPLTRKQETDQGSEEEHQLNQ
jgi:hypothetical protein